MGAYIDTAESGSTAYDKLTVTAGSKTWRRTRTPTPPRLQPAVNRPVLADGPDGHLTFTGVEDDYLATDFVVGDTTLTTG